MTEATPEAKLIRNSFIAAVSIGTILQLTPSILRYFKK